MAITKGYDTSKAFLDYSVYAPLGAADKAVEQAKGFSQKAWQSAQEQRKAVLALYGDLAKRGEKLAKSIGRSAYTRRAVDQTKSARGQVKAAADNVRKAAGGAAEATRAAARKVG